MKKTLEGLGANELTRTGDSAPSPASGNSSAQETTSAEGEGRGEGGNSTAQGAHYFVRLARHLVTFAVLFPVRFYQLVIGPLLPKVCRFHPSCSDYFIQAVNKHGPLHGSAKGIWRVCRCNPWNEGGYDPP